MLRFFLFLKKIHYVLLFVILEFVAFHYFANSTSYTKAKMMTVSNYMVGGLNSHISNVKQYFSLKHENQILLSQVVQLSDRVAELESVKPESLELLAVDSSLIQQNDSLKDFTHMAAQVVNNSITNQRNYLTINRGSRDGVQNDMAILNGNNVVGYVIACSANFAVGISVLNIDFKTSGRILGDDYFGSIWWDGKSYEHLILSDIPKYAKISVGDTVVTTNYSSIFPANIMIGTISEFELMNLTSYQAKVKISSRIGAVKNVVLVKYQDAEERRAIENSVHIGN